MHLFDRLFLAYPILLYYKQYADFFGKGSLSPFMQKSMKKQDCEFMHNHLQK
ncbi:hypothetical protein LL3_01324 [Bacillus sp. CN2]|uniref:Uncharacterized protein n=1 Tax=Bacillus amyloliquefaciens (strain Y2) TaxID=1155777 RepID=I2C3W4_BACAY|nr:hypothetical protein LL3_01324 [Bacillus amyloliquefaciens LL3]AEK89382.1 hypothetical protein BAXH7_02252 [Bacillus amyloliquefaciens XH7]AFJ61338.1 hypothetical protein MUS_1318 [Bacillus velezensis YAU B9601-Y2]AGZ55944.1 hypothetical protein U471_12390 [Bacillus amyloliquefaciens CC178]ANF36120.1 hypothetical protein BCBMB205_12200 [Bacillus velezensis]KYC88168.1 hypothetical protein B4140_1344 [Bacillus amyloliquefaciens]GFR53984.1 hypothetical protein LL3_01324 [Bacillus sp. CN2]